MLDRMDGLSTGEVAHACDVSPDTIRYYVRRGAIAAERNGNGGRRFPASAIDRVRVIRNAIAIGFTLDEIVHFFSERRAGRPPCKEVRAPAGEKLAMLDEKIREMHSLRDQLAVVLAAWDSRLAEGEPAHLLESLPERSSR
jgi:DNA-binding transcriptional MerR regulator